MAMFMIDMACLGLKNGFVRQVSKAECDEIVERMGRPSPFVPCELDLAAKVIEEAERYARDLGFESETETAAAKAMLGDADPARCDVDVPLGSEDGRPEYIIGPHDDPAKIVRQLLQRCGDDGFIVSGDLGMIPDATYDELEQHPNVRLVGISPPMDSLGP